MALGHGCLHRNHRILKKDGDKKIDNTAKTAVIQNSTEGVLSAVQGNANAIGYISLGSLTKSVKALEIDGVKASRDTVLDGEYPLQRPFNIVWSSNLSKLGQDLSALSTPNKVNKWSQIINLLKLKPKPQNIQANTYQASCLL